MRNRKKLWIGSLGTVVTALCCFTPILAVLFTAIGVGGLVVYLDAVLLPLLFGFVVLCIVALVLRRKAHG